MYETYSDFDLVSASHLRVKRKETTKWVWYGAVATIFEYSHTSGLRRITLNLSNGDTVHIEAASEKIPEIINRWLEYTGGTKK